MYKLISSSTTSIGLERTPLNIKGARLAASRNAHSIIQLFTLQSDINDVKPLYIHHPILTTNLEGKEVLVRPLYLPLTKEKDIEAALAFQAEPILPYPGDQALLAYQIISKTQENTDLTLLATRKENVQSHIESWQKIEIEPEKIACTPSALCQFGKTYISETKAFLILHLKQSEMTCVLIKEGKLLASFGHSEGLNFLSKVREDGNSLPHNELGWQAFEEQNSQEADALKRLKKEIVKMGFALSKELKAEMIEGIAVTGEAVEWDGLSQLLIQNLHLPLLSCEDTKEYSSKELMSWAVPIGLALGSLPGNPSQIDFRQQELSFPYPWRRLVKPILTYFAAIFLLSLSFYFYGQQYLHFREDQIKQTYLDLLSGMHKSHDQFEIAYSAKNPKAHEKFNGEIPSIDKYNQDDLYERINFLQKELQASPDSFPLFANIPRVSDLLAWLSHHPSMTFLDEEGNSQSRLQIENFSYAMLKRPQQGKKQEKYQVKVELEFSSPTPKSAREFHDALIAPNDWVDPKGEVKWSSNRGKYKTSFFLKDKTIYPSS